MTEKSVEVTVIPVYTTGMMTPREALERAVQIRGGQLPLAKAIDTTQSNVWTWLNKSKKGVPAGFVIPIETATGVSRHDLRPDIYPRERAAASTDTSVRASA